MPDTRIIIRHTSTGSTLTASGETVNITGMTREQRRSLAEWISDGLSLRKRNAPKQRRNSNRKG